MMDMPVVPTTRLKSHICKKNRTLAEFRQGLQIGIPNKVLCKSVIWRSNAKMIQTLQLFFVYNSAHMPLLCFH